MITYKCLVVICLKIRTFVVSATTGLSKAIDTLSLWFAWKFVPLWYQQQRYTLSSIRVNRCDLLENSYLCGISNNSSIGRVSFVIVVICLKIRTFVVSATTIWLTKINTILLWFAWKFVPLWYQQQRGLRHIFTHRSCDLLENSYLCGISNNLLDWRRAFKLVVICLKIRTFVVSATTLTLEWQVGVRLWFAWKFVPLWYQQQLCNQSIKVKSGCDLLENSYLCGISNNLHYIVL